MCWGVYQNGHVNNSRYCCHACFSDVIDGARCAHKQYHEEVIADRQQQKQNALTNVTDVISTTNYFFETNQLHQFAEPSHVAGFVRIFSDLEWHTTNMQSYIHEPFCMFLNLSDLVAILKKAKQSAANNKPATHETATYKTEKCKTNLLK